jgi:hypothetical protein
MTNLTITVDDRLLKLSRPASALSRMGPQVPAMLRTYHMRYAGVGEDG